MIVQLKKAHEHDTQKDKVIGHMVGMPTNSALNMPHNMACATHFHLGIVQKKVSSIWQWLSAVQV